MILNEFDVYQAALKKINLNEEVMPIYKGRVLTENVDAYCKIQKLLACNHLEGAHRWLYDLDIENLSESEINKVCNLYKLGVDRGLIADDEETEKSEDDAEKTDECDLMSGEMDAVVPVKDPVPTSVAKPEMPTSAYTVVYSAMRDGQIKTGEAYSNSLNTRSAKADVISKLEKAGYQNISILAIEAGDPDMVGCDNTFCKQADFGSNDCKSTDIMVASEDEEQVDEADDKEESSEENADNKEDDSKEEKSDSEDGDKKEEDAEEPDEKIKDDAKEEAGKEDASDDKESDELSDADKTQLKDSYKKAFKATMQKCKYFDKCFDDLTLEEKVKFFETINDAWKNKADPSKFMSDKELETLEKVVVKK